MRTCPDGRGSRALVQARLSRMDVPQAEASPRDHLEPGGVQEKLAPNRVLGVYPGPPGLGAGVTTGRTLQENVLATYGGGVHWHSVEHRGL